MEPHKAQLKLQKRRRMEDKTKNNVREAAKYESMVTKIVNINTYTKY